MPVRSGRNLLKVQALFAALAIIFAPAAAAQLPGGLGTGPILRGIDDAVDRTIDRTVDRTVTDAVTGRVDRSVEKLLQAKDLGKTLLDPLLDLPLKPLRQEVRVEENWRALDHEWIALLAPEQLPALEAANVQIVSRRTLASTGLVLVRVVFPIRTTFPAAPTLCCGASAPRPRIGTTFMMNAAAPPRLPIQRPRPRRRAATAMAAG